MVKFTLDIALNNAGKTRYWLSKQTKIDNHTLANMYNNSSVRVSLETLNKICKALDCELIDLITYEKEES